MTSRNGYNSFPVWPGFATRLSSAAQAAGVFSTGIESDRRGRGESVNVDLVGYDESANLAVIQVRQCRFRPGKYNKVRKDYYLLGLTESGNIFAHPVETPLRSKRALVSPEATVAHVLVAIWQCPVDELHLIRRQGDVAFVPAVLPKDAVETDNCVVIRETHRITGKIYRDSRGVLYCERAVATHTKGQHEKVRVKDGYYRIQAGVRASTWGFTAPRGD